MQRVLNRFLTTALLLLAVACGNGSEVGPVGSSDVLVTLVEQGTSQEQGASQQDGTQITLVPPKVVSEFLVWVQKRIPEISKELGVRQPKALTIYIDYSPTVTRDGQDYTVMAYYMPDTEEIIIWTRYWINFLGFQTVDYTLDELKEVLYHEFLHHYDQVKGIPRAPVDHNEIFRKRIQELGWK